MPSSRGLSTRIEVRSVDPNANPYMALATILQVGLDGIKNKTKVPEPVNQNIYEMNREEREVSRYPRLTFNTLHCFKSYA